MEVVIEERNLKLLVCVLAKMLLLLFTTKLCFKLTCLVSKIL